MRFLVVANLELAKTLRLTGVVRCGENVRGQVGGGAGL